MLKITELEKIVKEYYTDEYAYCYMCHSEDRCDFENQEEDFVIDEDEENEIIEAIAFNKKVCDILREIKNMYSLSENKKENIDKIKLYIKKAYKELCEESYGEMQDTDAKDTFFNHIESISSDLR